MVILTCVNKGTFIFMQSLGDAKVSTALSMMREVLFGVGLPLLLPLFFGLDGVLYFMPLADILTFVASLLVVARTNKKLRLAQAQQTEAEQKRGTPPGYDLCPDVNG
jgi:Na+-driven multidrug efflux pump